MIYRGIFWIKSIKPFEAIVLKSKCLGDGSFVDIPDDKFLSKNKENFNHRLAWQSLDKRKTFGKPYNYYPRGRVEIKNHKATVFVNENVICEEFEKWVKREFNLSSIPVRIISDMSNHYLCHTDREKKYE